jgi:Uma2 family endonuclease
MWKGLPQATACSLMPYALIPRLPKGWCYWGGNSIRIDDYTAPFPDGALVWGCADDYCRRGSFPNAGEVGLIVEVFELSLRKDLTQSLQTYARAGVPIYWVVNLVSRRVEVYSDPQPAGGGEGQLARYAKAEAFEPGGDVPLVLDGREVARIPARDLLPGEAP